MEKKEEILESLNTILKHRDIYDAISHNVKLFAVKNLPIEPTKEATNKIRNYLGVNIDFIVPAFPKVNHNTRKGKLSVWKDRFKDRIIDFLYPDDMEFSVLYENHHSLDVYIKNLKIIKEFCETYSIDCVKLRKQDLALVLTNKLDGSVEKLFGNTHFQCDSKVQEYISHDLETLSSLIQLLESVSLERTSQIELRKNIRDHVIIHAFEQYLIHGDLNQLFSMVKDRFSLLINSENTKREKNGKIEETVTLNGQYVQVITHGEVENVTETTMTLYDYFDVIDEKSLKNRAKIEKDELLEIAIFYIHLWNLTKENQRTQMKTMTFFDQLYEEYEKELKQTKRKFGFYLNKQILFFDMKKKLIHFLFSFFIVLILYQPFLAMALLSPYMNSTDSERQVIQSIMSKIGIDFDLFGVETLNMQDYDWQLSSSQIGDTSTNQEAKVIATVTALNDNVKLPNYYARSHSNQTLYSNGKMKFLANHVPYTYDDTMKLDPTKVDFEIKIKITPDQLLDVVYYWGYPSPILYPVGDNYELMQIVVEDAEDPTKRVVISNRQNDVPSRKTGEVLSIKNPVVKYGYQIGPYGKNSNVFVHALKYTTIMKAYQDDFYETYSFETLRTAVLNGLGLEEQATDKEIFQVIKSKNYSFTPLKDAKVSTENMNEEEYLYTIASLDSLNCNMATTLIVKTNQGLVYVSGYCDYDGEIMSNERHAWAMNQNGDIIDATPILVQKNIVEECIDWGIKHNIPLYTCLLIAGFLVEKKLGKKIKFYVHTKQLGKLLIDPNSSEAYAAIKDVLSGGINVPKTRSVNEFIDTIATDFSCFHKEELQDLKERLEKEQLSESIKQSATGLVDSIPFITENSEKIKEFYLKK